jgi:ribose transport system permease protein
VTAPEAMPTKPHRSARRHLIAAIDRPAFWITIAIAIIILFFIAAKPDTFATTANVRNIFTDASELVILSVGMTFVLASGGIDLSIGSVVVFSSVTAAKVMVALGGGLGSLLIGFGTALASGLAWGMLNGVLSTKARVPPLIVTLGTLGMALGCSQLLTSGNDVIGPPQLTTGLGLGGVLGAPWLDIIALVVAVLGGVVITATIFGRHILAIGSNVESARRSAIRVDRRIIQVYALMGLLSGLAGYLVIARFGTTTLSGDSTDNLQAIAATVLGGTSLFGGAATMFGTVVGAFIPIVLQNGFVQINVPPFWQEVAVGAILILAVYVDQRRRSPSGGGGAPMLRRLFGNRSASNPKRNP